MSGELFTRKVQKNRTIQIPSHLIKEYFTIEGKVIDSIEVIGDYDLKDKVLNLTKSPSYHHIRLKKYCGIEPEEFVEISVVKGKLKIKKKV